MTPGTITPTFITTNSSIASNPNTQYTFTFTTSSKIISGAILRIDFPNGISVSEAAATANNGCTLSVGISTSNPPCSSANFGQTIYFNGFFTSNVSAGTTLTATVPGVTNLRYVGTSSTFTIQTTDSAGNTIDIATTGPVVNTVTARSITSGSISIDNAPVLNGETDSYVVTITPSTALVVGDRITLTFPTMLTVSSSATCSAVLGFTGVSCSIVGN